MNTLMKHLAAAALVFGTVATFHPAPAVATESGIFAQQGSLVHPVQYRRFGHRPYYGGRYNRGFYHRPYYGYGRRFYGHRYYPRGYYRHGYRY